MATTVGPTLQKDQDQERMQFQRIKPANIYFRDYLCDEFKKSRYAMPNKIRQYRNIAIVLAFIELVCCVACVPFYVRRKSKLVLAFVILCFVFCGFGLWAKIRLSSWGLLLHAVFTIAIIGGLYIY